MATNAMSREFGEEILKYHNSYRAKHDSPGLKINEKLNALAQEWAENLAKNDKSEHRPNNVYGENIYMATSTDPKWMLKAETPVKAWYEEFKFYKYGEPSPRSSVEVGHFTQLVWKGTTDMGIGAAKSKTGRIYVVCNYDPPGNVLTEYNKNVLPSRKMSKSPRNSQAVNEIELPEEEEEEEEEEPYDRENIVLTPSQEAIGIRFVQPNMKVIKSMERLHAVPSEKIRVWSVWYDIIQDKAWEWLSWLLVHLKLVLCISDYLMRAENALKSSDQEERKESIRRESKKQYRQDVEIEEEKAAATADVDVKFEQSPASVPASDTEATKRASSGADKEKRKSEEKKVRKSAEEKATESSESRHPSKFEPDSSEEKNNDGEENQEDTPRKISGGETSTDEHGEEQTSANGEEKLKKRTLWPIGTPWEPIEGASIGRLQTPEKRKSENKEDQVEVITIPENEEDMRSLIRNIKEQATIFRSLYKHWKEAGDQAYREVHRRKILDSDSVPTHEEIPYFFYVSTEPDIAIGEEHEDEKILLPDLEREKIVSNFTPLYFNLTDKPGKR